eukprot:SAG31_NODE_41559_length_275_cov_0.977273_1_plen_30_part_10
MDSRNCSVLEAVCRVATALELRSVHSGARS